MHRTRRSNEAASPVCSSVHACCHCMQPRAGAMRPPALTWQQLPSRHGGIARSVVRAGTVFAFNAYHIGKERCYFQVACLCNLKVWVNLRRAKTLRRLQLKEEWLCRLVDDKCTADLIVSDHGVGPPQLQELQRELDRPVVGFQCTGAQLPHPQSDCHTLAFACVRWSRLCLTISWSLACCAVGCAWHACSSVAEVALWPLPLVQ